MKPIYSIFIVLCLWSCTKVEVKDEESYKPPTIIPPEHVSLEPFDSIKNYTDELIYFRTDTNDNEVLISVGLKEEQALKAYYVMGFYSDNGEVTWKEAEEIPVDNVVYPNIAVNNNIALFTYKNKIDNYYYYLIGDIVYEDVQWQTNPIRVDKIPANTENKELKIAFNNIQQVALATTIDSLDDSNQENVMTYLIGTFKNSFIDFGNPIQTNNYGVINYDIDLSDKNILISIFNNHRDVTNLKCQTAFITDNSKLELKSDLINFQYGVNPSIAINNKHNLIAITCISYQGLNHIFFKWGLLDEQYGINYKSDSEIISHGSFINTNINDEHLFLTFTPYQNKGSVITTKIHYMPPEN